MQQVTSVASHLSNFDKLSQSQRQLFQKTCHVTGLLGCWTLHNAIPNSCFYAAARKRKTFAKPSQNHTKRRLVS